MTFQLLVAVELVEVFLGFLPGQNYSMTAEQIVDNPVPQPGGAGNLQGFPRGQGSTTFSEQIPEFPDPGGGREDFQPVQGSAVSSSDSPGQAGQGFFSTFLRKKKSAKIPRTQGSELGAESSSWTRRELSWGLRWHNMGCGFFSLLLRSKSGASWSAPLVYPLTQWLGAAAGADCAWLPVRHGGLWKNFLFYVPFAAPFAPGNLDFAFALVSFISVFGCCLWSASYSGCVLCLVQQWIHVLREAFGELHIFSPCGELRSDAFTLHSAEWRSVHS